jgi:hypothetical protein
MWTYTIGPALALLPERWRAARFGELGVDWARAAAISGLIEGFGAVAMLVVWYSVFVTRLAPIIDPYVRGSLLSGYVGLFSFAAHPLTWVICYFGCEGVVRFLAAVVTGEGRGTLPLALVAWAVDYAARPSGNAVVPDEVTAGAETCDLQVASSRAKDHWKYPLTICYCEQFYQVMSAEFHARAARPHVYFLRKLPPNETIKGLEQYDPNLLAE